MEDSLKWFASYISNRTQVVKFQNTTSDSLQITTGVPQGSILGPLLFLVFINDLPKVLEHSNTYLFADDTIISVCDHDIGAINSNLNKDLAYVIHWARLNKLIMNTEKTYSILFITSQCERRVNTHIFKLYLIKLMLARVFER